MVTAALILAAHVVAARSPGAPGADGVPGNDIEQLLMGLGAPAPRTDARRLPLASGEAWSHLEQAIRDARTRHLIDAGGRVAYDQPVLAAQRPSGR